MSHPLGVLTLLTPAGREACTAGELAELEAELNSAGVETRRVPLGADPGATVRREIAGGARYVVVCGSQRAFTEVVPAVVESAEEVVVGVFPGSRPHDFARTFGLRTNAAAAALSLTRADVMLVDVGVVTLRGLDGNERRHYLFNDAVIGLGAVVSRRMKRLRPLGRLGGLLSWWATLATYRRRHTDVDMVFAEWHAPMVQVRISNAQFAHDGLHIAPMALPDDGVWDVQVWDGPRHLPFTLQPKMLLSDHVPHRHISQWRQKRVEVTAAKPAPVAVDDTVVGTTPATFELLQQKLRLKI
ncbi:MAG: diacylglycerol kinase family protein [Mycobacteriales bacterium]